MSTTILSLALLAQVASAAPCGTAWDCTTAGDALEPPIHVVVLLDDSLSDTLHKQVVKGLEFGIERLLPDDRVTLLTSSDRLEDRKPNVATRRKLRRLVRGSGRVDLSLLSGASGSALLAIVDDGDVTMGELDTDIPLTVVGVPGEGLDSQAAALERLALRTNGQAVFPAERDVLDTVADALLRIRAAHHASDATWLWTWGCDGGVDKACWRLAERRGLEDPADPQLREQCREGGLSQCRPRPLGRDPDDLGALGSIDRQPWSLSSLEATVRHRTPLLHGERVSCEVEVVTDDRGRVRRSDVSGCPEALREHLDLVVRAGLVEVSDTSESQRFRLIAEPLD